MNHYKIPKSEPLRIPLPFRPLDAILFGLIAILMFWMAIVSSELADLERVQHDIQTEVRP
jgi:hypothetical protein